ncbi:hypothetical protein [[Clostridium] colinum]|uniref:hypothetical protein n=1 Tax=[Clostridium] colinum TaxID=36835 RepID=UPI002024581F|nr:hypothetical protein [[Clostridium] colinum]
MFALAILYYSILALVIVGTIGIICIKNKIIQNIIIFLMIILSLCIGFLSFTSFPSNYIIQKILALFISIIPLICIVLLYYKKINWAIFKYLVILSTIIGTIYLIF